MPFRLGPPPLPPIRIARPDPRVVLVPVRGPAGPQGPPGDASVDDFIDRLEALEAEPRGWEHEVSAPTTLVQIVHGLPFKPAGITCTDTLGNEVEELGVSHPSTGITEVSFGAAFTGVILLS